MMYSRSRRERKFARREAAERQAQEVARQASDFFMLVSERTGAFLAVDLPPHDRALMLRSTDAKLSDAAVLARMPDGRILAAAARSFLNLCGPFSSLSSGEAETGQAVCAGTRESADEPHFKLLRGNHAMQINTTVLRIQPL
mmetsp:Transcript_32322/g.104592  ORF Transcript_32322/g.104592 Transcript_32322/m.104592 type:complete len:142 (+) Transcript_32322:1218-1643(+)